VSTRTHEREFGAIDGRMGDGVWINLTPDAGMTRGGKEEDSKRIKRRRRGAPGRGALVPSHPAV
jgi:hypothetical protein